MAGVGISCLDGVSYMAGESIKAAAVQTAATIKSAAATAIAASNAEQAVANFRSQQRISKRSLAIAQTQQQRLRDVFWPHELEFLEEYGTPETIESVEVMGRRYAGRLISAVADKFARRLAELRCSRARYCTSAYEKQIQDLLLVRSETIAAMRVLGRNIAFTEYQVRTDTNFKRQLQAVAIGRGLMADAARLLGQAAGNLAGAGNAALAGLNSALQTLGEGIQDYSAATRQLQGQNSSAAQQMLPYTPPAPNPAGSVQGFGSEISGFGSYDIGLQSISSSMRNAAVPGALDLEQSGLVNGNSFPYSSGQST